MPPKKSIQKTSNRAPTKGPAKASKNKKPNTNVNGQKKKTKDQKVLFGRSMFLI
jgi:hypothetical protein